MKQKQVVLCMLSREREREGGKGGWGGATYKKINIKSDDGMTYLNFLENTEKVKPT